MFSKLLVCLLLAAVNAVPQGYGAPPPPSYSAPGGPSGPVVPILVDVREGPDAAGVYNFNFETGDGISRHEQGAPQGPEGAVAAQGGWSFTFPDGTPAVFNFVADGSGYSVQSDFLPTPHPLPPHAIAQIEKARQEDAAAAAGGARPQYSAPPPPPSQGYGF
ncbi:cuticle protein AM1239-like isoform X2 [Macrobrachium nipponense]|uniref:cuticle protein AM1239-like isoform X1 n=1 Tax=Macrobrachium nipponense TaxID=159736 RepID=UPI0030C81933